MRSRLAWTTVCVTMTLMARAAAQEPHGTYTIDVLRPDEALGAHYARTFRVTVIVRNMNPFLADYSIRRSGKTFPEGAVLAAFGGPLGVTLSPPTTEKDSTTELLASQRMLSLPLQPDTIRCREAGRLSDSLNAIRATLLALDEADGKRRILYDSIYRWDADSGTVMSALASIVAELDHRLAGQPAYGLAPRSQQVLVGLKRLADCGPSVRDLIDIATAAVRLASHRDSLYGRDTLERLVGRHAVNAAPALFTYRWSEGDFDDPTYVDIAVRRRPRVSLPLELPVPESAAPPPTKGNAASSTSQDTSGLDWRGVADTRLYFGERRRFGLGFAVVWALGRGTRTVAYAAAIPPGDTLRRIAVSDSSRITAPLLTLSARLISLGYGEKVCGCGVSFVLGTAPSLNTQSTAPVYAAGVSLSAMDDHMALVVTYLNYPSWGLVAGFAVGQALSAGQSDVPIRKQRVGSLAVGLNVRPW